MEKDVINALREELRQVADETIKCSSTRFFKEPVSVYGIKTSVVSKMAGKYFAEIKSLSKKEIFALCEELWRSDYCEEAFIACEWSYRLHDQYEENDFPTFEKWLQNYVNNWAKCDTLCNHTIGSIVERYPRFIANLKEWTQSDNRWVRRAAAVTLIIPAKKGKFLADIFEISDSLLRDADDMVQKGYGWLLKDASITCRDKVFDYIMRNRQAMPRTSLRYALEKMPPDLRKQAMAR